MLTKKRKINKINNFPKERMLKKRGSKNYRKVI